MSAQFAVAATKTETLRRAEFAREVRSGLTHPGQKELPARFLYDDLGSALFEAITHLPEYGVTRADERVIQRAAAEIGDYLPSDVFVVELGSGSGTKTGALLEPFAGPGKPLYLPIDVSAAALLRCQDKLEDAAHVVPVHHGYLDGLEEAAAYRQDGQTLLLLFLGSNIGNFDRAGGEDFLRQLRRRLEPGDGLLLGTDLEKPEELLLAAYDDPTGVTAAFNRNVLGRINRELGGDFNLCNFQHEARYNREFRRVEMHLRSLCEQTVTVGEAILVCELAEGETIWTEASHKYVLDELPRMAERAGFRHTACWEDEEWPFAESLWIATAT